MPIDFIPIDTSISTAHYAGDLANFVRQFRAALDQLDFLKSVMDHLNDGSSFTQIEAQFGLAAGKGQTVYDLMNGTSLAIAGSAQNSNALSLINRVG